MVRTPEFLLSLSPCSVAWFSVLAALNGSGTNYTFIFRLITSIDELLREKHWTNQWIIKLLESRDVFSVDGELGRMSLVIREKKTLGLRFATDEKYLRSEGINK